MDAREICKERVQGVVYVCVMSVSKSFSPLAFLLKL